MKVSIGVAHVALVADIESRVTTTIALLQLLVTIEANAVPQEAMLTRLM